MSPKSTIFPSGFFIFPQEAPLWLSAPVRDPGLAETRTSGHPKSLGPRTCRDLPRPSGQDAWKRGRSTCLPWGRRGELIQGASPGRPRPRPAPGPASRPRPQTRLSTAPPSRLRLPQWSQHPTPASPGTLPLPSSRPPGPAAPCLPATHPRRRPPHLLPSPPLSSQRLPALPFHSSLTPPLSHQFKPQGRVPERRRRPQTLTYNLRALRSGANDGNPLPGPIHPGLSQLCLFPYLCVCQCSH